MTLPVHHLEVLLGVLDSHSTGDCVLPANAVDTCLIQAKRACPELDLDSALLTLTIKGQVVDYSKLRGEWEISHGGGGATVGAGKIAQQDLVFKILPRLKALWEEFDRGGMNADGLRAGLKKLGLQETTLSRELLRQSYYQISFNQLLQALTKVDDAHPPSPESKAGIGPKRFTQTTRGLFDESRNEDDLTKNRRKYYDPALYSAQRETASWGSSPVQPAAALPRRGASPSAVTTISFAAAPSASIRAPLFTAPPTPAAVAGPITAAVPLAPAEKALLRQQVHAAIRHLDGGELTVESFQRRIEELGITKLPPQVGKLLQRHKSDSTVPFKDWVRAFESVFDQKTFALTDSMEEEALKRTPGGSAPVPKEYQPLRGATHGQPSNGDILSWLGPSTDSSHEYQARRRQIPDFAHKTTANLLVPQQRDPTDASSAPPPYQRLIRGSFAHQATSAGGGAKRSDDFLTWSNVDAGNAPSAVRPMRGFIGNTTFRPAPFAREGDDAVSATRKGTPDKPRHVQRAPFGTEADFGASFAKGVAPIAPTTMFG